MLTCALRAQVKKLKKEIKNKFYIESLTFATFETLNAHIPGKTFYIYLLNLYPQAQVNLSQVNFMIPPENQPLLVPKKKQRKSTVTIPVEHANQFYDSNENMFLSAPCVR